MPISITPIFTNIWQGPANVFLNVDVPLAGARMKVDANGLPDTTAGANANAKWLGTTQAGSKFTANLETTQFEVDEYPAPFRTTITKENAMLEGNFAELLDLARLAILLPNAMHVLGAGPPAFDQITMGGLMSFSVFSVAMIGKLISDPTKYAILQMYAVYSSGGLTLDIQRKQPNYSPFKFEGQSTSRAAGDQMWTFWIMTP